MMFHIIKTSHGTGWFIISDRHLIAKYKLENPLHFVVGFFMRKYFLNISDVKNKFLLIFYTDYISVKLDLKQETF